MRNAPAAQPSPPHDELSAALEHIWGAGLDWATSEDFQNLSDDERDATYIRYQTNVINKAKALILAQRQEAMREFAGEVKNHLCDDCEADICIHVRQHLDDALQTYLEGEQKKFDRT